VAHRPFHEEGRLLRREAARIGGGRLDVRADRTGARVDDAVAHERQLVVRDQAGEAHGREGQQGDQWRTITAPGASMLDRFE